MSMLSANVLTQMTLKKRIVILVIIAVFVPFIFSSIISFNAITNIMKTQLNSTIHNNLKLEHKAIENTIHNLNHISQQMSYAGTIGAKFDQFSATTDPYTRTRLSQEINSEINSFYFTNPGIGLVTYYGQDAKRTYFNNHVLIPSFNVEELPAISSQYMITIMGPHLSNEQYNDKYVLSLWRNFGLMNDDDLYIYIEASFKLGDERSANDMVGDYLLLDPTGNIIYSENEQLFPSGTTFLDGQINAPNGEADGAHWFIEQDKQGWYIASIIPSSIYNKQLYAWFIKMAGVVIFMLSSVMLISWLVWMMIYKPLRQFVVEIKNVTRTKKDSQASTNIPEFDYVLQQLQSMKLQINELIHEVEQKEKKKAELEVEKLLYQINPHFLMNTLDTVHWLAVMNGQQEINKLVSSLNKLLYYNLGKVNKESTIREELDSLTNYLTLQQVRYNFNFNVRTSVEQSVLDTVTPRFILQPLVENALYHGLDDEGSIDVDVRKRGDSILISVSDNGTGLAEEEITALLLENNDQQRSQGLGIGLNYVKRMIHNQYGNEASLSIISEHGTTVTLTIPYKGE